LCDEFEKNREIFIFAECCSEKKRWFCKCCFTALRNVPVEVKMQLQMSLFEVVTIGRLAERMGMKENSI